MLLTGRWLLSPDPGNTGRDAGWPAAPPPDARPAPVPGVIQQVYPDYHGVAWYWLTFDLPPDLDNARPDDRWLLRFEAVDYLAEVWLNGRPVGRHEGGETPFELDVTAAARPNGNLLAVRVLNPTHEPIDGITIKQTPHRNREIPFRAGASWNFGGIVQDVRLERVPAVRISTVFARADSTLQALQVETTLRNDSQELLTVYLHGLLAPAIGGNQLQTWALEHRLEPGERTVYAEVPVEQPHLWSVDDPFLYRVSVEITAQVGDSSYWQECSARLGFRRFEIRDGFFHLNGRRLFVRSSHTGNHYPVGAQVPPDRELLRRDLVYAKAVGYNMIRFIAGLPWPEQLDLCDELGLLVYEESLAGWCLEDSPQMAARFDRSTAEMVRRDRNHPSVVIWGLLNETPDGPVFRHAVDALPLVRELDESRLVLLGSGRWDGQLSIGSVSNPWSHEWEHLLGDEHPGGPKVEMSGPGGFCPGMGDVHAYPRVPHDVATIRFFRTLGGGSKPVFLSEYGIGSLFDPLAASRGYEQIGASPDLADYRLCQEWEDRFRADWDRLGMGQVWPSPPDFIRDGYRMHARQRLLGLNAIRSNPQLCGYNLTGTVDQGMTGEGVWTFWRELKDGALEALRDGLAPVRWCVFAEPLHAYAGESVRIEAVLADEDVLPPGEHTAILRVVGPRGIVLERHATVTMLAKAGWRPLARPVFDETLTLDGPAGRYEVAVELLQGGMAAGGRAWFTISDLPASLDRPTAFWGTPGLGEKLAAAGIPTRPWPGDSPVVLVGRGGDGQDDPAGWPALWQAVEQGATAALTDLGHNDERLSHLPLSHPGRLLHTPGWVYHRDDFAKLHPIFAGLPAPGLLDLEYYRAVIPDVVYDFEDAPAEVTAGGVAIGYTCPGGYAGGAHVAVYRLGKGRLILSTLRLLESLGEPVADRLLWNLARYASGTA